MMMQNTAMRSVIFIIAGMAIIGLIDNFISLILAEASIWQFHAFRTLISLPALWILARLLGQSMRIKRPGRVALRSLVLAIGMLLYFGSLPLMPIAQAGAGMFTSPIWVLVFSALIYRKRIGPRRMVAVALGTLGVVAMLRPESAGFSAYMLVPVLAGAFYAMANIMARSWCAEEPTLGVLGASFAVLGLIGAGMMVVTTVIALPISPNNAAAFLIAPYQAPRNTFWIWTLVQAFGSLLAVGMVTRAYQGADTSYVTIFEYSFLLFASFWGWQLHEQAIDLRDVLGMGLIVVAGIIGALSVERHAAAA